METVVDIFSKVSGFFYTIFNIQLFLLLSYITYQSTKQMAEDLCDLDFTEPDLPDLMDEPDHHGKGGGHHGGHHDPHDKHNGHTPTNHEPPDGRPHDTGGDNPPQ